MISEMFLCELVDKEMPENLKIGQVIDVFCDDMDIGVSVTVIRLHKDGSFDGRVVWEEA
jgi:hypothetical protein